MAFLINLTKQKIDGKNYVKDNAPDFIPADEFVSDEDKYGGLGGTLAAAGLGAARGISLSASDLALTKLGLMTPEELKGYQAANPIASMGGEMAGTAASIAYAPEAALAKVILPAAGIAKIGSAVTKGALKLGTEAKAASKILEKSAELGAVAAGSAVEGALYSGISSAIHETALGDPDLNGEKILSNFGYGALWGGGLGGLVKGASMSIPPAVEATRDGIVRLRNTLIGTGKEDAGVVGKLFPNAKFTEAIKNRTIDLDKHGTNQVIRDVTAALDDTHHNIQTAVKELNSKIRPEEATNLVNATDPIKIRNGLDLTISELDTTIKKIRSEPELYDQAYARELELQRDGLKKLLPKADEQITKPKEYNEFTGVETPEEIVKFAEPAPNIDIYNKIRETKQALAASEFKSKTPGLKETNSIQEISAARKAIDSIIKDPEVFGELGTRLAEHDDFLHNLYKFIAPSGKPATELQKAFMVKTGTGIKASWKFDPKKVENVIKKSELHIDAQNKMKLLDDYHEFIKTAPDHIEKTLASVPNESINTSALDDLIEKSQNTVLEGQKTYITANQNAQKAFGLEEKALAGIALYNPAFALAVGAYKAIKDPIKTAHQLSELERLINKSSNLIGKGVKKVFDKSEKILPTMVGPSAKFSDEERQKKFKKTHETLTQLNNDPVGLIDRMYEKTANISDSAPRISQSLQLASIRANQFLASKLPFKPDNNPLEEDYLPSKADMQKYERYEDLVENPMKALDHIRNNMVTPETVETLSVVYPKLYDEMKLRILDEVTERVAKKEKLPYQLRQSISMFLQTPIDSALQQQSILLKQQTFPMVLAQQANEQVKIKQAGMDNMDISGRTKNVRHEEA